jgi:hypothetical protein
LAADVLFAVFAPAFPFVVARQEIRPQTAKAHSLSVMRHSKKRKKTDSLVEKIFDELSAVSRLLDYSATTEFADFPTLLCGTFPRRFSKERI